MRASLRAERAIEIGDQRIPGSRWDAEVGRGSEGDPVRLCPDATSGASTCVSGAGRTGMGSPMSDVAIRSIASVGIAVLAVTGGRALRAPSPACLASVDRG